SHEKGEHENAEEIAGRERSHQFGPKGEEVRPPGEAKNGSDEMRDAIGDFRVLQKSDDDAKKPENATRGDQTAGIERARAGFAFVFFLRSSFDQRADKAAGEHGSRGSDGKIGACG